VDVGGGAKPTKHEPALSHPSPNWPDAVARAGIARAPGDTAASISTMGAIRVALRMGFPSGAVAALSLPLPAQLRMAQLARAAS